MVYSLNLLYDIYLQFSGANPSAVLKSHHSTTLSHLNNDLTIQNMCKLISIEDQ